MLAGREMEERAEKRRKRPYPVGCLPTERSGETAMHRLSLRL